MQKAFDGALGTGMDPQHTIGERKHISIFSIDSRSAFRLEIHEDVVGTYFSFDAPFLERNFASASGSGGA